MTAMVAIFQQFIKYRRDGFNARVDEFCKLVFEAADYAADYWVAKKLPPTSKDSTAESRIKMRIAEARIGGFQQKINLFFEVVSPLLNTGDRDRLTELLAEFFDSMTGGNFGAKVRSADETRARLVYTNGSDVVARLRASKPTITWQSIFAGAVFLVIAGALLLPPLYRLTSKH